MKEPQPSQALIAEGFDSRVVLPYGERGRPLVIGEAPGRKESEDGIPFHPEADAGGLFKRLCERVGVKREQFSIWNCVNQRPPQNELYDDKGYPKPYTHDAIAYWKPFLHQFIEEMAPPVIIGLGRTALEVLTGFSDIGTTRGYVHQARIEIYNSNEDWDAMYDKHDLNIPTICTYHPQFLNYGQKHLSGVFLRDILTGLDIAQNGYKPTTLKVVPTPSIDEFKWFCSQYNPERHRLTYDIETPETRLLTEDEWLDGKSQRDIPQTIERASFCFTPEVGGWSIPWVEPFVDLARGLLASDGAKAGWNIRLFDRPRLEHYACFIHGREYDLLDCWRHLHRTLPASLAFVAPFYVNMAPWKQENHSQPEWYSAMDAIVEHLCGDGMERDLRTTNQWETYESHVVDILALTTKMAENGLPFDQVRAKEFEGELEVKLKERQQRLQAITPIDVRKTKKYKSLNPELRKWFIAHGTEPKHWVEHPLDALKELYATRYQEKNDGECYTYQQTPEGQWMRVYDFNPNSHIQKKALIRHFNHKLKTNRKSKKETSDDNTLKGLITTYIESEKLQDKVAVECYQLIRECVAISKVLGTYVRGWRPGADGLIHATPGIWGDMFRISWRAPNLAATVADKKEVQIASGFRKCIAVRDEQVIIESDWRGMEAVLVAHFSGDSDYMRLAQLGVHSYLASHIISKPADLAWSNADLYGYFKEVKGDHPKVYDDAKHCIAEGELVLTDSGLIPIQNITLDNKLWDGVEWVSHDGLVDQGIREVITYDGLTATADHQVFTQDGTSTTLGLASLQLERLQRTGIGGTPVWVGEGDISTSTSSERLHSTSCSMYAMLSEEVDRQDQPAQAQIHRLSAMQQAAFSVSQRTRSAVLLHHRTVQQSQESRLQALRSAWYQVLVQILQSVSGVDDSESSTSYVSRYYPRTNRQQRTLRTRQLEVGDSSGAAVKQADDGLPAISREACTTKEIRQPLHTVMDFSAGGERNDGRADHRECTGARSQGQSKELEAPQTMARRARVYDILNVGPRHRFTVSGRLVHNCVHGVSYGMTAYLMAELYEMTRTRAQQLISLFFDLFPKVRQWQQAVIAEAHEKTRLMNAWGYRMPIWDAYTWNQRRYERLRQLWVASETDTKRVFSEKDAAMLVKIAQHNGDVSTLCYDLGSDAKAALSFYPRDTGAAMLKDAIITLENTYALVSASVLRATAHDALLGICDRRFADETGAQMQVVMERPQPKLGGLVIKTDLAIGQTWDKKSMRSFKPVRMGLEASA